MGVREGLLALLARGPRHGYQLKLDFEQATAEVWPVNIGQVYTTLQRLERDELREASPGMRRGGARSSGRQAGSTQRRSRRHHAGTW